MKSFYKLTNLFLVAILTLHLGLSPVWALERPTPPPKPEVPIEPTQIISPPPKPSKPTPPPKPLTPTPTSQPEEEATIQETDSESSSPSQPSSPSDSTTVENSQNGSGSTNKATSENKQSTDIKQQNQAQIDNNINVVVDTGGNKANRNTAQTTAIETGDANIILGVENNLNSNSVQTASSPSQSSSPSNSTTVENSQNGANSTNQATSDKTQATDVGQGNTVQINNQLTANASTGGNSANYNTGGDVALKTGNANVGTTVVNFANTNQATVKVKEFNILDDQRGDIVLDFTDAEVIDPNVVNSKNGAGSTNQATSTTQGTEVVGQFNQADLGNAIVVNANTGDNKANYNTDGNVVLETGDANVVVNVINFLNNNLSTAGEVLVGVVNVVGNLIGDIILPQNEAANKGNGAGSTNEASLTQTQTTTLEQTNRAHIQNSFEVNANTGENKTNYGTAGSASTQTGSLNVNVETATIANQNTAGEEPIYVVLVNKLGQWTGQILGVETSSINEGNGAGSTNQVSLTQESTNTTTQVNSATVNNNIVINANTGGNEANYTTGGDVSVKTGDVNVAANVVNFLNNNFSGRKIIITIVNVLGSWVGNLVGEPAADTQDTNLEEELAVESTVEESNQPEERAAEPVFEESVEPIIEETTAVTTDSTPEPIHQPTSNTTPKANSSPEATPSLPTPTPSLPSQLAVPAEEPVQFEVGDLLALLNTAEPETPEIPDSSVQLFNPSSPSQPSLPSWSNQFKPSLGFDIEVGNHAPKLPWELSSGGLMLLGLIFNLMKKRFFA